MGNVELISFAGAGELASRAAGAWLDEIESANRAGKTHCVALSGGRIAQKFFASTVGQAKARAVSFARVHFFWADERCVPPTDPESNFKLAGELLFAPLKIAGTQIHRIRGEEPPDKATALATAEIIRIIPTASPSPRRGEGRGEEAVFSNSKSHSPLGRGEGGYSLPVLDLIFLGMGEDGHVASLFPDAPPEILNGTVPFLAIENSPKPPPRRISLSYAAIAAAKQVWLLASGAGKAAALRESLSPDGKTPLARVIQSRLQTKIFSDIQLG
jgi:6-phosphogluconolactonase